MPDVEVSIDSGVNLQVALFKLLDLGITGLQWYARIPGTIGGAVFNNIHGGNHVFSDIIKSVVVLDEMGEVKTLTLPELKFEYDKSRFHKTKETILEVRLGLKRGDVDKARATAVEWIKRKAVQPMNSAGCVFKNIAENERSILGYPTTATGYIVEHILNMTGFTVGGATISADHHNFIVNNGGATAKDYLAVRDAIVQKAIDVLGLSLENEIILVGEFE
jgi:UDP-N-acetylmuramate dehydrogenase